MMSFACLTVSCSVMFGWRHALSKGKQRGSASGGEWRGRGSWEKWAEGKLWSKIYCKREKSMFNKKEKEKKRKDK